MIEASSFGINSPPSFDQTTEVSHVQGGVDALSCNNGSRVRLFPLNFPLRPPARLRASPSFFEKASRGVRHQKHLAPNVLADYVRSKFVLFAADSFLHPPTVPFFLLASELFKRSSNRRNSFLNLFYMQ